MTTDPLQPASPEAQAAQVPPASPTTEQNSSGGDVGSFTPPASGPAPTTHERMTPLFSAPAPLYPGVDAAYPGNQLPAGTRILGGYIGIPGRGNASPDTPNIWTAAEWNQYAGPDPDLRLLPFYVHNYADGQPAADAANAIAAATAFGWSPGLTGEAERIIVIDTETLVDYEYFRSMGETIQRSGFRVAMYGSASTVKGNPPFAGYILADWNNKHAPTALSPGTLGVQWKPGGPWDLAVYSQDLYFGCGHGVRGAA